MDLSACNEEQRKEEALLRLKKLNVETRAPVITTTKGARQTGDEKRIVKVYLKGFSKNGKSSNIDRKDRSLTKAVFEVEKRVVRNQVFYNLMFKGKPLKTTVEFHSTHAENVEPIVWESEDVLNFDAGDLLQNFALRVSLRTLRKCQFVNGELVIDRGSDDVRIFYNAGIFGDERMSMNLNPFKIAAEVVRLADHFGLEIDPNEIEQPDFLDFSLCFCVKARGNLKAHFVKGLSRINDLFEHVISKMVSQLKKGKAR